jgi:hypothetical protein
MAKNGFKLIDAEMHVMEPVDLWERYIDPEFAPRAPRRLNERRWDIRTIVEGEVMAAMPGGDWPALTDAEERPWQSAMPRKSRGISTRSPRCGRWTRRGSTSPSCFRPPPCM